MFSISKKLQLGGENNRSESSQIAYPAPKKCVALLTPEILALRHFSTEYSYCITHPRTN